MNSPPTERRNDQIMGDSDADLQMALQAARELWDAADRLSRLAFGQGSMGWDYSYSTPGNRAGDKAVAVKDWIGPTRDTFEDQLYHNEAQSAEDSITAMQDEARAWAAFWKEAIEARERREHSSAMVSHREAVEDHQEAILEAQEAGDTLYLGAGPVAPPDPKVYPQPFPPGFDWPSPL